MRALTKPIIISLSNMSYHPCTKMATIVLVKVKTIVQANLLSLWNARNTAGSPVLTRATLKPKCSLVVDWVQC